MTYTDNLLGRLFFNFSDISSKQQINSELLFKIKCGDKYDPIVLSTYAQILVMYRKVSKAFLHKVILTNKTYTATAYHYLTWLTESSLLLSIYQGPNIVLIPMTFGFRTTISTFVFNCFTRMCDDFYCIFTPHTNPFLTTMKKTHIDNNIAIAPITF